MIRLSKMTDYGFVLLTRFCLARPQQVLNARDLAAEVNVPQPTVSKLLKLLAKGGLLTARRGVNGGYALARASADITVADVIGALEGPIAITECSAHESCSLEGCCPTKGNWQRINMAVYRALQGITLADMVRRGFDPAQSSTDAACQLAKCRCCPEAGKPLAVLAGSCGCDCHVNLVALAAEHARPRATLSINHAEDHP